MSEPHQIIYTLRGKPLAFTKWGVFWSMDHVLRLGEFYESKITSIDGDLLANFVNGQVYDVAGQLLGVIEPRREFRDIVVEHTLILGDSAVGYLRGTEALAAAAGLVFCSDELQPS